MIKEAIPKLIAKNNLTQQEMEGVFEEIMSGAATPVQIASFLTALRMKTETVDEITAAAVVMRRHARKIKTKHKDLLDTCGTGGDSLHTFNISTISALVCTGAGVIVAKHGNRAVSSKCGSADLLEALGVKIDIQPERMEECLDKIGIAFLFAPYLHPAMRFAAPVRREIGIRTIFNLLGPLTNPADAKNQILGVYDKNLTEVFAQVLKNLGSEHVLVVSGLDGLDEVSTTTKTKVSELINNKISTYELDPTQYGIKLAKPQDLIGQDAGFNAKLAKDILEGKECPQKEAVLLNAACGIYAANKTDSIKDAIKLAQDSLNSKRALEKLNLLIELTN